MERWMNGWVGRGWVDGLGGWGVDSWVNGWVGE